MQVVSNTPFRVATLIWQPQAASFAYSVLCKATFVLRPGQSLLAPDQEVLQKEDAHWGHDPLRSIRWASDLAPRKPRADIVLTGQVYAPNKVPVRSLVARLAVGGVDKSIEVVCQRYYDTTGTLRDGPPFVQTALLYERAAAGPENPSGMRPGMRDSQGRAELPNLMAPGAGDAIKPIGFGPIAATWPFRLEKLGHHAASWDHAKWYRQPLAADMDMSYFNCAPPDQQVLSIREDERIVLENLHPEHPIFVTCLPGIRPVVSVELAGQPSSPVAMRCDTLHINTDQLTCTLVWRGHFPVDDPRVEGRVIVGMETAPAAAPGRDVLQETAAAVDLPASPEQALPFHAPIPGAPPSIPSSQLPSVPRKRSGDTMSIPVYPGTVKHDTTPPPVSVSVTHDTTPPPPDPVGTPMSGGLGESSDPAPIPLTIGQAMTAQASTPPDRPPVSGGFRQPEMLAVPKPAEDPGARVVAEVSAGGVLAASNAAIPPGADVSGAAPQRVAPVRRGLAASTGEVLRLVWFDLDGVPRIRRKPDFRAILDDLAKRPPDREADHARVDETPAEIEDRREVLEVLLCGETVGGEGVREAVNAGIRDDGRFVPAAALVSGDLEMTFDAVETLKALLPVAASFAGPDDALAQAVAGASTFLQTPGFPSPLIADTLAERVRKAYLQTHRGSKVDALDDPAERVLVERRLYRRRPVFGATFVRASMILSGSPHPVPVYFPEAAVKKLPLVPRYRARLIAETHLAADPSESQPVALRALALGELLPGGRR